MTAYRIKRMNAEAAEFAEPIFLCVLSALSVPSCLRCGGFPRREITSELLHRVGQRRLQGIVQLLLLGNGSKNVRMARLEERVQLCFERAQFSDRNRIEVAVR